MADVLFKQVRDAVIVSKDAKAAVDINEVRNAKATKESDKVVDNTNDKTNDEVNEKANDKIIDKANKNANDIINDDKTIKENEATGTAAEAVDTSIDENVSEEKSNDAKSLADRYKEYTYKWADPKPESLTGLLDSNSLLNVLQGAFVAGLGLFLICSPTSGILTQVIGSLVFLSGIVLITY